MRTFQHSLHICTYLPPMTACSSSSAISILSPKKQTQQRLDNYSWTMPSHEHTLQLVRLYLHSNSFQWTSVHAHIVMVTTVSQLACAIKFLYTLVSQLDLAIKVMQISGSWLCMCTIRIILCTFASTCCPCPTLFHFFTYQYTITWMNTQNI